MNAKRSVSKLGLALIILLFPVLAFAQGAGEPTLLENLALVFKNVVNAVIGNDFVDRVINAAKGLAGSLKSVAMALAGVLALIQLIWNAMLAMLEKKPVIPAVLETVLFSLIAAALLTNYSVVVDTVYGIAKSVLSAVGLDIGQTFMDFIKSLYDPVARLFVNIGKSFGEAWGTWKIVDVVAEIVLTVLVLVVAIYFIVVSLVSLLGVFIMGPIFLGVGIVIGPLMVATIVSRYTRAWFGQWLNYLVSSAFLTVGAVIVLKLLSTIFASSFEKFGEGKSAATALGIAMIAAGMTKLFESIPSITDAIFPGRTGAAGAINSNAIGQAANPINSGRNAVAGGKFAASKVQAGYQGGKAIASKVNSWFSKPPTPPANP